MTADAAIRARVGDIPVPTFDSTPATTAVPLRNARVAIVTTARLRPSGQVSLWQPTDGSFTVLPGDARDVQLSHFSPNFDRTGFATDLNVVYPVDRLNELAGKGEIGSVAGQHLSFMGAQTDAIRRAFALLDRTDVPVIEDHPEVRPAYNRQLAAAGGRTAMGRVGGPDQIADLAGLLRRSRTRPRRARPGRPPGRDMDLHGDRSRRRHPGRRAGVAHRRRRAASLVLPCSGEPGVIVAATRVRDHNTPLPSKDPR